MVTVESPHGAIHVDVQIILVSMMATCRLSKSLSFSGCEDFQSLMLGRVEDVGSHYDSHVDPFGRHHSTFHLSAAIFYDGSLGLPMALCCAASGVRCVVG